MVAGKTTLINSILGLIKYQKGNIKLFGKSLDNETKSKIGIVPQELAFFDTLSAEENIDFFCGLYISDSTLRKQYVKEAIEFTELQDFRKFLPKKLSGGLKRRLNIACGIVHKPSLIFFDEPTVAVDTQSRSFILDGIRQLNEKGSTIIYTTHYLDEADDADMIYIVDHGQVTAKGSANQIKENYAQNFLKVFVTDTADFKEILKEEIPFEEVRVNELLIHPETTEKALEILTCGRSFIRQFEFRPGTMDDAFMALTGREVR